VGGGGGGGGGAHLKKLRRAEGGANIFGVFRVIRPKIIFFPILGGARGGCAPPAPEKDKGTNNDL
jgi:hypothetical protein